MAEQPQLEHALAKIGHDRANTAARPGRKQDIKAKLFGDPAAPARIGRFIDLGLLGRGAMGTVRRAYDEQLAREVAIKLVNDERSSPQHRDRLKREAQALAQLSHPNVVQIYEVGDVEGEIFIAMELVDGVPLDDWHRESHSWRECLEVYVQAGRGLAAAHASGLIHRDFKPSNCIRDRDGRVRVLDFGLARALDQSGSVENLPPAAPAMLASTAPGLHGSGSSTAASNSMLRMRLTADNAVLGTIAYMAPEQFAGRPVDARSDQFSLCVALYEALYGQRPFGDDPRAALIEMAGAGIDRALAVVPTTRPVPRQLRRALRRGLRAAPADRWPTIDALLHELERPLRPARWRLWSSVIVLAGTTAMAAAAWEDDDPCLEDAAALDEVWNEDERQTIHDALAATEAPYAGSTWATVERELDAYADAWKDASVTACRASAPFAVQHCLQRRRFALTHRIGLLSEVDAQLIEHAATFVAKLPSVSDCAGLDHEDSSAAASDGPRREQTARTLERALALHDAARYAEGLSVAAEAVASAAVLSDRRLHAQALLVQGRLQMSNDQPEAAEPTLDNASTIALRHGPDELVVEAKSLLSHVVGIDGARSEQSLRDVGLAVDLAERPGVTPTTRALAHTSYGNLSTVRGEADAAERHYEQALEILEREHGADHLLLTEPLEGLATAFRHRGELAMALRYRKRATRIHRKWHGERHPATAVAQVDLASILYDQGDHAAARRTLEQAITILEQALGTDHSSLATAHNGLAAVLARQAEHDRAAQEYRQAIRIWDHTLGPDHLQAVIPRLNLASLLRTQGDVDAAVEQLEAVLEILRGHEATPKLRRLLAQALRDLAAIHRDRQQLPRAEALYREGIESLERGALERDSMLASLRNGLGRVMLMRGSAV
ncbi:MAG: serine/threonine-protein kinase, partial [Nannocystaceae bacterium]